MKEQLISFETALLAEKKGFDKRVENCYGKATEILYSKMTHTNCKNDEFNVHVSAPTQSLLQKWLREEHDIQIIIGSDYKYYDFGISLEKGFNGINHKNYKYTTYELALETCLFKALNMITL